MCVCTDLFGSLIYNGFVYGRGVAVDVLCNDLRGVSNFHPGGKLQFL